MIIKHRGIHEDRFDTPVGMGTMIAAIDCYGICKGCFHHDMRNTPIYEEDADEVLDRIKSNPFCKCLVLGFFEWLDYQYKECIYLIEGARSRGLDVILYTRRYEEDLRKSFPKLFNYPGLYIKCGPYISDYACHDNIQYGVPLATSNQYIIQV